MNVTDDQAIHGLRAREEATRLAAAQALATNSNPQAATALLAALADPSDEVRQWVGEALENLGPPPIEDLPSLIEWVQSNNDDQAYWAVTLIGRLGSHAKAAETALGRIANEHAAATVRRRAESALGKIEASS